MTVLGEFYKTTLFLNRRSLQQHTYVIDVKSFSLQPSHHRSIVLLNGGTFICSSHPCTCERRCGSTGGEKSPLARVHHSQGRIEEGQTRTFSPYKLAVVSCRGGPGQICDYVTEKS